jgi:tRNA A37 methylthiotransferase MiaB
MKGLGGQVKKDRSSEMTELKMDVVGEAYESMVGTEREVLLVEDGTEDSLVGYDSSYRQVAVPGAEAHADLGEIVTCEITGQNTVYALGELCNR